MSLNTKFLFLSGLWILLAMPLAALEGHRGMGWGKGGKFLHALAKACAVGYPVVILRGRCIPTGSLLRKVIGETAKEISSAPTSIAAASGSSAQRLA
jgi:hypothetical protein